LDSVLEAWSPALLVIDDEEDAAVPPGMAAIAAATYAERLRAACEIAHARGIPCANGGLTERRGALFAWLSLRDHGSTERACAFAQSVFPREADTVAALCTAQEGDIRAAERRAALSQDTERWIEAYRATPVDWVNFHWFSPDARAFAETAEAIGRATGKPVMSNALGQRPWNADAKAVRPVLRAAVAARLRLAIWYSLDTSGTVSLLEADGRLRPTGWEFQRQLSGRP